MRRTLPDYTHIASISWTKVFAGWRDREEPNPGWTELAHQKGWPNWESWRAFTALQFSATERSWQQLRLDRPNQTIPDWLIGPFPGWQRRCSKQNLTTFAELLSDMVYGEPFRSHAGIEGIRAGLPFSTQYIGFQRADTGQVALIDGHHRACATTLSVLNGAPIDWSGTEVTIALTTLSHQETAELPAILAQGTNNPSLRKM